MTCWHLPGSPVVDHLGWWTENPDASLFVCGAGNGAFGAHDLTGLSGFADNDDWRLFVPACAQYLNNQGSNNAGHDHSGCR
jgi:hypothetical protein